MLSDRNMWTTKRKYAGISDDIPVLGKNHFRGFPLYFLYDIPDSFQNYSVT